MTEFTREQLEEIKKCKEDLVYFINNYVKISEYFPPIKLYDYQEDLIRHYHKNQFSICKAPRQCGKSFTAIAYALHHMLFNEGQTVGLFSIRPTTARSMLIRLKEMYLNLPTWMRMEVTIFNNNRFELENGSIIYAESVSPVYLKGLNLNLTIMDELAFVDQDVAKYFINAMMPVIFSGKNSKLIICSTPSYAYRLKEIENENGETEIIRERNIFYDLWYKAHRGVNAIRPFEIFWKQMPGKDEKWKEEQIKMIGKTAWKQEYECKFTPMIRRIK